MPDWDNILKSAKNVRSKDNISLGQVVAIYNDHIIVIDDVNNHSYKISKSNLEKYDGSELYLNIDHKSLKKIDTTFKDT